MSSRGADVLVPLLVFALGAVVSLSTSWVLVSRLERLGHRFSLPEGVLGLVAALAADAPEITAAVTALSRREHAVGAGVVLGSNVFNLAALLGLAAVMAGRTRLHRRVIVLDGMVGLWMAAMCLMAVTGLIGPVVAFVLCLVVLVAYVVALLGRGGSFRRVAPARFLRWLAAAVAEEETEIVQVIRPRRGGPTDAAVAAAALVVVVSASAAMERAASVVGRHWDVPGVIIGGVVLAVVTSLPNAVAGVYLGRRGRGAALLSTAMNSNSLNVVAGLLLPAAFTGLTVSGSGVLVAAWYAALTALTLGVAWSGRGISRLEGWLIVAGYGGFLAVIIVTSHSGGRLG